jgi:hypothetical protein
VNGAINTITSGNPVYIGEQGLDITAAMDGDTQIGWWASAASISDSAPTYVVPVSNPTSFSVTPSTFGSQMGVWYRLNPSGKANGSAFNVVDPKLALFIEDTTVSVDVTDKWVPSGDELRFRLESNLVPISQRAGQTSVPITIKVQAPDGGIFSSLLGSNGAATSIVDIPVTTTPYYTASIWDTSQRANYPPGTYSIWAECNVNSMKDNYNEAGKTVSQKVSLLNQDNNPLIAGKNPTVSAVTTSPPKTTLPLQPTLTSIPATVKTPSLTTVVTTATQTTTEPTLTSAVSPTSTKSPGFEGILTAIAFLVFVVYRSKY